jgi:hypothetical protein
MDTMLLVKGSATTFRFLDDAPKQEPQGENAAAGAGRRGRRAH